MLINQLNWLESFFWQWLTIKYYEDADDEIVEEPVIDEVAEEIVEEPVIEEDANEIIEEGA